MNTLPSSLNAKVAQQPTKVTSPPSPASPSKRPDVKVQVPDKPHDKKDVRTEPNSASAEHSISSFAVFHSLQSISFDDRERTSRIAIEQQEHEGYLHLFHAIGHAAQVHREISSIARNATRQHLDSLIHREIETRRLLKSSEMSARSSLNVHFTGSVQILASSEKHQKVVSHLVSDVRRELQQSQDALLALQSQNREKNVGTNNDKAFRELSIRLESIEAMLSPISPRFSHASDALHYHIRQLIRDEQDVRLHIEDFQFSLRRQMVGLCQDMFNLSGFAKTSAAPPLATSSPSKSAIIPRASTSVDAALRRVGLERLSGVFAEHGFEEVEGLAEVTASDLQDMGLSTIGERRTVLAMLAKLKNPPSVRVDAEVRQPSVERVEEESHSVCHAEIRRMEDEVHTALRRTDGELQREWERCRFSHKAEKSDRITAEREDQVWEGLWRQATIADLSTEADWRRKLTVIIERAQLGIKVGRSELPTPPTAPTQDGSLDLTVSTFSQRMLLLRRRLAGLPPPRRLQ